MIVPDALDDVPGQERPADLRLRLARAVANNNHASEIDESNRKVGDSSIRDAVHRDICFFVDVNPSILACDFDESDAPERADNLCAHRERGRLLATTEADFLRFVRQALDGYGDAGRLLRSPLTDLPAVDRRLAGRVGEQPLARALELRHVLQEAVADLRPAGPFSTGEEWRHYNVLHFCCLVGLRPEGRRTRTDALDPEARRTVEWVRQVPRHLLRRWQSEGVAQVARRLWDDMVSTDPRWLTRLAAGKRPSTTRST